ncbi:MAG: twin-arginine translocation signal domain-containing protein [Lachnospiraceae bacterium]|nr:twin-arginine translocation signal domain-containing protein [Lachnospiraceae bacterium]
MSFRSFSRRDFIKGLAVGGAAFGSASLLTACGQTKQTEEKTSGSASESENHDGMTLVATIAELKVDLGNMSAVQYVWLGDQIYYLEDYVYDDGWTAGSISLLYDKGMTSLSTRLKVRSVDGTGDDVVLNETEGRYVFALFEGTQSNLAMIITECSAEDQTWKYYLIQTDLEGNELSRTELSGMEEDDAAYISGAAMDEEGNVAYIVEVSYVESLCHLILKDGTCVTDLKIGDADGSTDLSVLKMGEEGLYLTEQYLYSYSKQLRVWSIDFSEKKLIQEGMVDATAAAMTTTNDIRVLADGERFYLTTEHSLYLCDIESGEQEEILKWTDQFISADGSKIGAIRTTETGYEALLSVGADTAKLVYLTWTDSSLLTAKKTILIATSSSINQSDVVQRFNESSTEYHAELIEYTAEELSDDLIYRSDVVPDVYDMRAVDVTVLEGLDLLEDLEPYFEASEVVSRKDILDPVWEAGRVNGKMLGIVTEFRFLTLYTSAEGISTDGWSLDDMIGLCDAYPESDLIAWYSYEDILEMIAMTGALDEYVDWENLTCSFDSEGFMNLLEKLTQIRYPKNDENKGNGIYQISDDDFLAQESLLVSYPGISYPYNYRMICVDYGEWRIVGYPTLKGEEPWYQMSPRHQFGIYSNSENKEGAWAFIEFLLTEPEQTWYAYDATANKSRDFPVRKDAFDSFLHRRYCSDASWNMHAESVGADVDALNRMLEHSHIKSYLLRTEIWDIILEEIPYYYEGAKSLEDVVGLIQNRCSLYLSEME